jgi:hypothetical protein
LGAGERLVELPGYQQLASFVANAAAQYYHTFCYILKGNLFEI